jgi:hypothetical protein
MNCSKCGVSIQGRILHRTKPKGQMDAGWTCEPCIKNSEPELYANILEDNDGVIIRLE